jgi:hypothetical protein
MKRHLLSQSIILLILMRNFLYILILALSFCSCGRSKASNRILSIELKDSVTLQIDSEDEIKMGSAYVINYQGNNCMFFWSTKKDRVFLYQLSKADKGMHITLDSLNKTIELLQLNYSFCYHNNDSMYGLSPGNDTIYCFGINGAIKKKWHLSKDKIETLNLGRLVCGQYANLGYYDEKNKLFYLTNCFNPREGKVKDFFSHNHYLAINLSEDSAKIAFLLGQFPTGYTAKQYHGLSLSYNGLAFYAGKILLNFYNSDSIYQHNQAIFTSLGYISYSASSNNFIRSMSAFDTSKESDRDYIRDFSLSNERYSQLLSRSNADYLFRVADKKYRRYNEDSTINSSIERPWQIVVIDKDLQIVGELYIPEQKLNSTQLIPYKNGFWIASLADYRKFYYYEIKLP